MTTAGRSVGPYQPPYMPPVAAHLGTTVNSIGAPSRVQLADGLALTSEPVGTFLLPQLSRSNNDLGSP